MEADSEAMDRIHEKKEQAQVTKEEIESPKDVSSEKQLSNEKATSVTNDAASNHVGNSFKSRSAELSKVHSDRLSAFVKVWEETEKTKATNKANKKLSTIESWEISKIAALEADMKKMEEKLEKKKAQYSEKVKNKIAEIHREAEEKKVVIEVTRRESHLEIEQMAEVYRETSVPPKMPSSGCFGV